MVDPSLTRSRRSARWAPLTVVLGVAMLVLPGVLLATTAGAVEFAGITEVSVAAPPGPSLPLEPEGGRRGQVTLGLLTIALLSAVVFGRQVRKDKAKVTKWMVFWKKK